MRVTNTNVVRGRNGGNSHLFAVAAVLTTVVILFVFWNTPSNNALTFDVSLEFKYQGQISGTFTLTYEWTSNAIVNESPGTYDITWTQNVVQAQGSPSLSVDSFIQDHFSTIVAEESVLSIDSSGRWEINILQLAGSFVNLNYAIVGSNSTIGALVISASVNKSLDSFTGDLSAYGVTNLNVVISAKITIPGNMLEDIINRILDTAMKFINSIEKTGNETFQLLASSL